MLVGDLLYISCNDYTEEWNVQCLTVSLHLSCYYFLKSFGNISYCASLWSCEICVISTSTNLYLTIISATLPCCILLYVVHKVGDTRHMFRLIQFKIMWNLHKAYNTCKFLAVSLHQISMETSKDVSDS